MKHAAGTMMSWIRVDLTRVFQGTLWLCLPCWKKGFAAQLCRTWLLSFRRSMPALHGCACPRRETCHSSGRKMVCAPRVGWSTQCQTHCHVDFLQKFPGEGWSTQPEVSPTPQPTGPPNLSPQDCPVSQHYLSSALSTCFCCVFLRFYVFI